MTAATRRRSFIALHLTLGLVIAFEGGSTLVHALSAPHGMHLVFATALQTAAAVLFLWPTTLRVGGVCLVLIFLTAAIAEAARGGFPAASLVYAAAALFVSVHGSAWEESRREAAA